MISDMLLLSEHIVHIALPIAHEHIIMMISDYTLLPYV